MSEYQKLATEIVEGTSDYAIDESIMDHIAEFYYDAESQIAVIAEILETLEINDLEDFETAFLDELCEGAGPMLTILAS